MEWIKNLKVGDSVIIQYRHAELKLDTVKRITKTMIITNKSEYRFRRETGQSVGNGAWGFLPNKLRQATKEEVEKIKLREQKMSLIRKIKGVNLMRLSVQELEVLLKDMGAKE